MPFSFLIYLQPTHYFRLYRKDNTSVFPLTENLPLEIIEQLEADVNFKSEQSRMYDLSWQALQKGYIGSVKTYASFEKVPLADEYRFLQKYFHKAWVFYVLLLRLISFHNPINEIKAWKKSSNVNRSNYLQTPINHSNWPRFSTFSCFQKTLSECCDTYFK